MIKKSKLFEMHFHDFKEKANNLFKIEFLYSFLIIIFKKRIP